MVWPPSWRRRVQLQPLAYNAIFHIDVPIHGFPAPPRFRQGKPHAEQQHGQSTFTPTSPAGSCHFHVPSCFAFLCVGARATKHLHYSPASLFTRQAKGWSLASGLTSQPATTDFALSKGAFIFISLLSSAASCLEVTENYPLSLYFPIKCSHLCKMQLYSLYINVNRARIINFSNISHASHTAWVSPTPIIFLEAISFQTSGLQASEGTHKDHRLQSAPVLQRWGIQHLQIPRAPVKHEQARHYETLHRVFLQKYMFFSCSSNPIIFPRHGKQDYQRVGQPSERFRTKFPSMSKDTKKMTSKEAVPPCSPRSLPPPKKCWCPAEVPFEHTIFQPLFSQIMPSLKH